MPYNRCITQTKQPDTTTDKIRCSTDRKLIVITKSRVRITGCDFNFDNATVLRVISVNCQRCNRSIATWLQHAIIVDYITSNRTRPHKKAAIQLQRADS